MKPYIIAITGPDGSGKSTVCDELYSHIQEIHPSLRCNIASIWDPMIAFKLKLDVPAYLKVLSNKARSMFLFHAVQMSYDMNQDCDLLILNAYWYKYAASEMAYGTDLDFIGNLSQHFPIPDETYYLDISPVMTLKRKNYKTSAYESGENYLTFQNKALENLQKIEKLEGPWNHLSSEQFNSQQITQKIYTEIKKELNL